MSGVGHHAMVFDELRVRVDCGGPWALEALAPTPHGFDAVCYKFLADPYVPGAVGKWEPTLPTEYDRTVPTERAACRPRTGCDVLIPALSGTP